VSEPGKDEPAAPLSYARGTYMPPTLLKEERNRMIGAGAIGFIATSFISAMINSEWILVIAHRDAAPPLEPMRTMIIVAAVAGVLLIAIALDWRRSVRRREDVTISRWVTTQGFMIGCGLACLIFGACAARIV
jgi:hypothetical protein